jgi:hypothetical protein
VVVEFQVVPDELAAGRVAVEQLVGHLAELIELGRGLEAAMPMVGPSTVVHAFGKLNVAWMRVAETVMDDLTVLGRRLVDAAETYEATEAAVLG